MMIIHIIWESVQTILQNFMIYLFHVMHVEKRVLQGIVNLILASSNTVISVLRGLHYYFRESRVESRLRIVPQYPLLVVHGD